MELKNPPVYFTVVQVQFEVLLTLSDFLPVIQEGLRKAGYPVFMQSSGFTLQIDTKNASSPPQAISNEQYIFLNVEQTHGFVLNKNSLTFQSTNYGTYQKFSDAFLVGLGMVHNEVNLTLTQRIGLRYLDFVLPKEGDELDKYLHPGVLNWSTNLGGQSLLNFSEAVNAFGEIHLRSRVVVQEGGLGFPPDLLPENMNVQDRFLQRGGRHAILDSDGFVEAREPFSMDNIKKRLGEIHGVVGGAFRSTTTEYARKMWEE
jgi:uncharacterized protein (TIGR04255 family)